MLNQTLKPPQWFFSDDASRHGSVRLGDRPEYVRMAVWNGSYGDTPGNGYGYGCGYVLWLYPTK